MRHLMSTKTADGGDDENLAEQWRLLGADPQRAAEANRPARLDDEDEVHEVWPEHAQAWECFRACANTQWRVLMGVGVAAYQGLDYGSLETVMRLHGVPRKEQRQVFSQVRILEDEALKHLNQ